MATKVKVCGLTTRLSQDVGELALHFAQFAPIKNIWVARNPPGFAFVTFEDWVVVEDIVRQEDICSFKGLTLQLTVAGTTRSGRGTPNPPAKGS